MDSLKDERRYVLSDIFLCLEEGGGEEVIKGRNISARIPKRAHETKQSHV